MPAPDRAAEPPKVGAFSTTTTLRPRFAARSAAVIPEAPAPTTMTSNCWVAAWAALSDSAEPRIAPAPAVAAPARTWRRLRAGDMAGLLHLGDEAMTAKA